MRTINKRSAMNKKKTKELTVKLNCQKLGQRSMKAKNNFLVQLVQIKTRYGYRIIAEFKHRYFEVIAQIEESGTNAQFSGVLLEYIDQPFHASEKKNPIALNIDVENPNGGFGLSWAKNKETLELYLVKDLYGEKGKIVSTKRYKTTSSRRKGAA